MPLADRHVVVVGAGFAGLQAARVLARAGVRVTVVDRNNFHTFQPLLYQVATAGLGADDIAHSVRGIFHGDACVDFHLGTVTGIDVAAREVLLERGPPLRYDAVVLAVGASTATFGVPGADEHALPLKTLQEAIAVRNHLLRRFEEADADPAAVDAGALTVAVVGGGPTGVELAGAIRELVDRVLRHDFHRLDVARSRVVLVEATGRLLGPFAEVSGRYALDRLRSMGVEVRLDVPVERIGPDGVHLAGGEHLAAATVLWVAGVRANPLADALGFPQGRGGRILVDEHLRVPRHDDVFVVGDVAAFDDGRGGVLPQLAPVAIQGGRRAARNVLAYLDGRPPRRFRYLDKGTMATVGRDTAVAELPLGLRFDGRLAWFMWLFLHLMYLVGFRNRVNVLVNWSWNYLTWDRAARLILEQQDSDR